MDCILHTIVLPSRSYEKTEYYAEHSCHYSTKLPFLTVCQIKPFNADMSYVLTEARDFTFIKFPAMIDDMGLVYNVPTDFSIWF